MAGTLYDHMEFPPYQFREYPKYINNDKSADQAHGKGVRVENAEEEEKYYASLKASKSAAREKDD